MALFIGKQKPGEVFVGHLPVSMIFVGKHLVWIKSVSQSCYSGGIWNDNLPWLDEDIWLDTIP